MTSHSNGKNNHRHPGVHSGSGWPGFTGEGVLVVRTPSVYVTGSREAAGTGLGLALKSSDEMEKEQLCVSKPRAQPWMSIGLFSFTPPTEHIQAQTYIANNQSL